MRRFLTFQDRKIHKKNVFAIEKAYSTTHIIQLDLGQRKKVEK